MTPESPSHFGDIQKFSGNFAHSQSLFRSGGKFCKPAHQHRMGQNRHIPQNLQQRVRELRGVLQNWPGRGLEGNTPVGNLHSSNSAWAGVDTASNRAVQGFWRDQAGLHINIKKLLEAVKSLAKKRRKSVHFSGQHNSFQPPEKLGCRAPAFIRILRPFRIWCQENHTHPQPILVRSTEQVADGLSRWSNGTGDYTLHRSIFSAAAKQFPSFQTLGGHVCQPWQQSTAPVCEQVAL